MPDRDVSTIRDLINYQYATIIAKSAFAASDGESSLKHRGDKKLYDFIPPILPSAAAATAQVHPTQATWTGTARSPSAISIGCWGVEGEDSMVDFYDSKDLRLLFLSS
jgi:hypothetical protein